MEKIVPDSVSPRRFTVVTNRMSTIPIKTRCWLSSGHRRGHGRHRCCNTHRHGQHIVGQERRAGGQGGEFAQIVLGDDIGAPAMGVRANRLPVGNTDDDHEGRNGRADGQTVGKRRQPAGDEENAQHLFGGICHRGQRIRRQHRQRLGVREAFMFGGGRSHRRANQQPFGSFPAPAE